MAGHQYGWHDRLGGVEPGFAEAPVTSYGANSQTRDERDDTPYGAPGSSAQTRNDEWLGRLLE